MEPLESTTHPGFYLIPGYSRYVISESGTILDLVDGGEVTQSRNPAGYINVYLHGDHGKRFTWGLHRLLCFVFKNPGRPIKGLVVNHENGVKDCNELWNLEWETYTGNAEHAGYNGLTTKCVPVLVRDVATGEVVEYPSAIKCARDLGITKDAVIWRINSKGLTTFPDGRQYKRLRDEGEWGLSEGSGLLVRELLTGKIKTFAKQRTASAILGVSEAAISTWLMLPNQPVLPGYIQMKLQSDPSPWRSVADPYLELDNHTKQRSVVVIDEMDDSLRVYPSAAAAAKEHGISVTLLNYRLKRPHRSYDGYRFVYYSDHVLSEGPVSQ